MTTISLIMLISAFTVLACSFIAICDMNHSTNHIVRLAFLILCAGEFAIVIAPIFGAYYSDVLMTAVNLGLALLCLCDRFRGRLNLQGDYHAYNSKG